MFLWFRKLIEYLRDESYTDAKSCRTCKFCKANWSAFTCHLIPKKIINVYTGCKCIFWKKDNYED